jgi:hypothetical protein
MLKEGKKYADQRYREKTETVDPEDVSEVTLRHHTVDITYRPRSGYRQKTVRSRAATGPAKYNSVPEGFYGFWNDGQHLAYNPEERRLVSLEGDSPQTLAAGEEIHRIERVQFPQRPPVTGAVQEDVEAEVFYWSDRSENLCSVTIEVERVEENTNNPWRIRGQDVADDDRRIEAMVRDERDITAKTWASNEVHLGKVARVEFPLGHRYVVDIRDLPDDKASSAIENIQRRLTKRRGYNNVAVSHDGRIPDED